ncbi:hypothetical protein [Mangrovimonas sp. YM274]|uniref:hypothetical protein n=1 Tax=Mangrovimonas sp. YM274 TaxID=3070660 RepID=UPI0027DE03E0|nr:hypothetical protein [Mangrovimonas sp. YM274]WMI68217.1 hypothetical protein RBH95_13825 [Mangrovimonas sp. YM274]
MRALLKDKTVLSDFDKSAVQLIIYLGFVWIILWLFGIMVFYLGLENENEKVEYINRLTGKYAYAIWIQPIFWFLLTQTYRIRFIKKYLINRIIISLLFVITFERFVILVVTLHRDYLPSSWTLNKEYGIDTGVMVAGLLGKILVSLVVFCLYHFGMKKLKNVVQHRV